MLRCSMTLLCSAATLSALAQGPSPAPAQAPPVAAEPAPAPARNSLADPAHALRGKALAEALRAGGFSIYFRHALTDFSQGDHGAKMKIEDCATQRNLSEAGRAQARAIAAAFAAIRLPVGEVLASPYCRTLETAMLIAGRATKSNAVLGMEPGRLDVPASHKPMLEILLAPPAPGTNRVLSGHLGGFQAVNDAPPVFKEGEAAVLRAIDGKVVIVARLTLEDWQGLAALP